MLRTQPLISIDAAFYALLEWRHHAPPPAQAWASPLIGRVLPASGSHVMPFGQITALELVRASAGISAGKELRGLVAQNLIALAGKFLERVTIGNLDAAARVADQAGALKSACDGRDRSPPHPEHLRQEFLGQRD